MKSETKYNRKLVRFIVYNVAQHKADTIGKYTTKNQGIQSLTTYSRILTANLSWEFNLGEILPVNCNFICCSSSA